MTVEDALQIEVVLPARITTSRPFLLPVVVINTTEFPIDENLSGTIRIGAGLTFRPLQNEEIHFGRLDPRQKVVLTWILLGKKEGRHLLSVQIRTANKVVATKAMRLEVSP